MVSDLAGLVISMAPVIGLLVWRGHVDRRQHVADVIRADVNAGAMRVFQGESLLAVRVEPPTIWRPGHVRLTTPSGYEPLIGRAFQTVMARVPDGYEVVIHCGGNS